jgi:hypothetical protein
METSISISGPHVDASENAGEQVSAEQERGF